MFLFTKVQPQHIPISGTTTHHKIFYQLFRENIVVNRVFVLYCENIITVKLNILLFIYVDVGRGIETGLFLIAMSIFYYDINIGIM